MAWNHRIYFFLFCCLLLQVTQPARAQIDGKIVYPEFYRYYLGDPTGPDWAQPQFDDSKWERIKNGTFPYDRWQGIGHFRSVVEVDTTLWNSPLGLSMWTAGAVDFYLDGELLHRFGKVGTSAAEEQPYWGRHGPRVISFRPISPTEGGKSRHLVAFHFSNFFRQSSVWSGSTGSLGWEIRSVDDLFSMMAQRDNFRRKLTLHQMLLTGVFLAFALLHLLLFMFYRESRANLYFAVLSACSALTVFYYYQSYYSGYFMTKPSHIVWSVRLMVIAFALTLVSAIRLTYLLIYPRLPRVFFASCFVGFSLIVWSWFRPYNTELYLIIFAIAAFSEMVRPPVVSLIKKRKARLEGGWIILLGMIPLVIVGIYYMLATDAVQMVPLPWEFADFPTPFYAMLLLMISISVFLSRNFARTEAENARKTKELEEARQLQLSMLPKTVPQLPNLEIAAYSKPATEVGGDYYDFHIGENGTLTVAIGDATGHGMSAGTMVSISKGLFKSLAVETPLPKILRERSSALANMNLGFMYMAMTLVKFKGNKLQISAAGMPPALDYKAEVQQVDEIILKGPPLGGFPDFQYQQQEMRLRSGDSLVLMSDGLPERFNDVGEMLDFPNARQLVGEAGQESPQAIVEHLIAAGDKWANGRPQDDDVTFVVMKMR